MILRDESGSCEHKGEGVLSAWDAVALVQRKDTLPCWFVTQPDHAQLSGKIAASLDRKRFPALTDDIVEAIGLHDEGWEMFDGRSPQPHPVTSTEDGRVLPFNVLPPDQFLGAWRCSIGKAEGISALAGMMVSRHFQALGRFGLLRLQAHPEECAKVQHFLDEEQQREARLSAGSDGGQQPLEQLVSVLQFCDLLSLHLCSKAPQPVEFPQDFGIGRIKLQRQAAHVVLSPTPLASPVSLGFPVFLAERDRTVSTCRAIEVQVS